MNTTVDERKQFATLQAQFALCGHALARVAAPVGQQSYVATRWGMARHLPDLEAVRQFLEKI